MAWILNHVNVLHIQNTKYINKIEKSNPKIVWIEIIAFNFFGHRSHKILVNSSLKYFNVLTDYNIKPIFWNVNITVNSVI